MRSRLRIEGLTVVLGGVRAVNDVSFQVSQGEVLGLIGPNGAGKTSAINAISGYIKPTRGRVDLGGKDVTGWAPERLVRSGLARTFQGARLFGELTVYENVLVSALAKERRTAANRATLRTLERLGLADRAQELAKDQPAGVQRLLGLARALATEPEVLLLDEPAAGLNDRESEELKGLLRTLADDDGMTLVVIEHDMGLIMGLCDQIHVLNSGQTLFAGAPADARSNPAVIEAYLGSAA